ncbi:MAG: RNA polymerase sigma factor, partial [Planctomycetota bacterium]
MDSSDPTFELTLDPNRLAAQTEWLRRLARRLIQDVDAAEDIVQDTLVAALERPPRDAASEGGLRAWLRAVAQNLARMQRRSAGRRSAREGDYAAGRDTAAPASDDVVVRATEARRLIDAVLALDEPYRRTLLLSYQERLSAKEIAARTGVTADAARKRISRGLAQLRKQLGAEDDGSGRSWLAGLAVLARDPQLSVPIGAAAWTGGTIVTMKVVGSAAACALLLVLGYVLVTDEPGEAARREVVEIAGSGEDVSLLDAASDPAAAVVREDVARSEVAAGGDATEGFAPRRVVGRVVLADGRTPVAGASLRAPEETRSNSLRAPSGLVLGETDEQGRFELTLQPDDPAILLPGGLWVQHPDAFDVHVDSGDVPANADEELEVRTVALGGVLVKARTPDGAPLPGAKIEYSLDPTIGSDRQLWGYRRDFTAGTTDASGELRVRGLPVRMPIRFGFGGEWRKPAHVTIDPVRREAELVVIQEPWCSIRAQLEWPDGSPAVGAFASWHGTTGPSGTIDGTHGAADASGELRIGSLAEGGGMLSFGSRGYHAPVHVRVEPGVETDLGVLTLEPPVKVSGRVLPAIDGASLPEDLTVAAFRDGVLVTADRMDANPPRFELTVPRGPVVLAATVGGRWTPILPYTKPALGQLALDAPASDVELRLTSRRTTVIGRVEDASGDVQVVAFEPDAFVEMGSPFLLDGSSASATLEADGSFRFDLPPAAAARILLELEDGRSAYSSEVSLVAGTTVDLGTLGVAPGRVEARILDTEASGVENATLLAMSHDREQFSAHVSGADGAAALELAPGPYGVRADADADAAGAWRLVHVESGGAVALDVSHSGPGLFDGVVLGADGPVAGVALKTQRESPLTNLSWSATTGDDGRFA